MRARRNVIAGIACAAAFAVAGLGCAGTKEAGETQAVVVSGDPGLDFETWFVGETEQRTEGISLEAALAPYFGLPTPMVTGSREICEANGIRIVSVPTSMIADLRGRVAMAGPMTRRGSGEMPNWGPVAAGPPFDGPVRLRLDSGPLRLDESGRMRLLTRGWLAPVPEGFVPREALPAERSDEEVVSEEGLDVALEDAVEEVKEEETEETSEEGGVRGESVVRKAAMYVEFVPQFVPERSGVRVVDALDAKPELKSRAAVDEGTPFPRLKVAVFLRPGETIVIMRGGLGTGEVAPVEMVGPMLPADATIGDAVFSDRLVVPSKRVQSAVVITARGPDEFRLRR